MNLSNKEKTPEEGLDIDKLRSRLEMLDYRVNAAKVAYLNRTSLDGKEISYEDLKAVANEYIQASYAFQKAKFGSVRVKISVAKLLR